MVIRIGIHSFPTFFLQLGEFGMCTPGFRPATECVAPTGLSEYAICTQGLRPGLGCAAATGLGFGDAAIVAPSGIGERRAVLLSSNGHLTPCSYMLWM
jgi:hypothetical protein